MKPNFPSVIDSTLISSWRSCHQKTLLESFHHWKLKTPSVHLHAGAAFASGLEAARTAFYLRGEDHETAVAHGLKALLEHYGDFECPADSAKSAQRMAGALEYYFDQYDMRTDKAIPMTFPSGKRGIEFSFLEPIDVRHPVTGDPLLYAGRFDMLADYENMRLGEDDKTASQLGASWPRQWDLRSQFTAYTWGAARTGIKLDGFLVRGISILKSKYETMEAITYRPQWTVDRWYEQMLRDVRAMIVAWETGYFDYALDHACVEYGGCPFRSACQMRDPMPLLKQQFERRQWNPVTRIETLLETPE